MILTFDLESNGRLREMDKIHSLCIKNQETGEKLSCANDPRYVPIEEGLILLAKADLVIGHNIIGFDLPAIKKVFTWFSLQGELRDTLNMSRLIFPHIMDLDMKQRRIPKKLYGRHKLEAWGHRLGFNKLEFNEGWDHWSTRMQEYCEIDVEVTSRLYDRLIKEEFSDRSIKLECDFQKVITEQESKGVYFNKKLAIKYAEELKIKQDDLKKDLLRAYPGHYKSSLFIPKKNNIPKGYRAGVPFKKEKFIEFNPGSRQQCLQMLKDKYGYESPFKTETGLPQLNEEVLSTLQYPEAKMLSSYFDIAKITGRIIEGDKSWMKNCEGDKISAKMITNGAITGRATHQIVANIPRVTSFFGRECRSLFHAGPYHMVGADASGLELRILAHYLFPYDQGNYVIVVTEGDVHTTNQNAADINTRDNAKTFIYALLYGAGDEKIGSIVAPGESPEVQKIRGKALRSKFMNNIPGFADLVNAVKIACKRGYVKGIDGRKVYIRSDHAALNTLLQSCGAIVMKLASVIADAEVKRRGIPAYQCIHYHDEFIYIVENVNLLDDLGDIMVNSIREAGRQLEIYCPLDSKYLKGKSWAEVH